MRGLHMPVDRIRSWLCDSALPLWADVGFDRQHGGFVERLRADGTPDLDVHKRTMVQARQIYVYSHAAALGLLPDASLAEQGFDFLMRHACPDGMQAGLVHAVTREGAVVDETRDSYGHAFFLLAFSWLYRATGSSDARRALDDIAIAIEKLRHPSGSGYRERDGTVEQRRRQNPHMHFLEAFLAAYAATGNEQFLARADEIVALFEGNFFREGMLLEFFDDDLRPAPAPEGRIVEPGHHHEWVWLLQQYEYARGRDMSAHRQKLYDATSRHGHDARSGLVFNEIWADGSAKDMSKRLWPQTEALKSELVTGWPTAVADATIDRIFRHFLEPAAPGGWVDRLTADNHPLDAPMPASSFYHLFLAFSEYLGRRP
jgi:mannose/cellobiose epimerase-like protein (N-acyl-D-glucosamine 2-epimerase family)